MQYILLNKMIKKLNQLLTLPKNNSLLSFEQKILLVRRSDKKLLRVNNLAFY